MIWIATIMIVQVPQKERDYYRVKGYRIIHTGDDLVKEVLEDNRRYGILVPSSVLISPGAEIRVRQKRSGGVHFELMKDTIPQD